MDKRLSSRGSSTQLSSLSSLFVPQSFLLLFYYYNYESEGIYMQDYDNGDNGRNNDSSDNDVNGIINI